MEDLNKEKGNTFAVIAYHMSDGFVDSSNSGQVRYRYYGRPEYGGGIPLSVINGTYHRFDAPTSGSLYGEFLDLFNKAASIPPSAEISLALVSPNQVQVEVTNTSPSVLKGKLHIALVERYHPFSWRDLKTVDFVCRAMLPGPEGQSVTIAPSNSHLSVQRFSLNSEWSYCSIVAFFQMDDHSIAQASVMDIQGTFPSIQIQGLPKSGDLLLRGSTYSFSVSSTRPASSQSLQLSTDGGLTWAEIHANRLTDSGKDYIWTVPDINASRCLLSVPDPVGAFSGLFAIGIKGDFNFDNKVDAADRQILIDYLIENKAILIPGADLNGDGTVDLFDLFSLEGMLGP